MVTGVILAGGQNRRMNGKKKALLPFRGETLLQRQIEKMRALCAELIVVTNEPELFSSYDVKLTTDIFPGKGPLSGMHAAFSEANNVNLWVVGCDMPFISSKAAEAMLIHNEEHRYDAVIPSVEDRLHPLHGIYRKSTADRIFDCITNEEYRVTSFLKKIDWNKVGPDFLNARQVNHNFVLNVNTPEQFKAALESDEANH